MMKLVIFDLDGTLLDTSADLAAGVNHTLMEYGLPQYDIPAYKKMVGRGMRNLVKSALPSTLQDDDFIDSFLKKFLDYYIDHIDVHTKPYPGIVKLLNELHARSIKLAVASNKLQRGTEMLIRGFFPEIPFVAVCGNSPSFPLKPDAALIRYIMSLADVTESDTVIVGDSDIDIQTAKAAGIKVMAVAWGFRPVEELADADIVVNTAEELLSNIAS